MELIIDSTTKDLTPWLKAFKEALPDIKVMTWDEVQNPDRIEVAILWNHRPEFFKVMKNVRLVCSLGAGVDHILKDPLLPQNMPITRIVSDELSGPMSMFCVGAVIYFERKFDYYRSLQNQKKWDQEFDPERHLHVGVMGLGELGQDLANKLVMLGFQVSGWSKTKKQLSGVQSFQSDELDQFLSTIDLLICMLPATDETKGILNKVTFGKMKRGSFLINVARGQHQVNEDILDALDSGQMEGAFLDVFPVEPLPKENRLWNHPKVIVTPHIAVVTKLEAAVPQIKKNIENLQQGNLLINTVDRYKGY